MKYQINYFLSLITAFSTTYSFTKNSRYIKKADALSLLTNIRKIALYEDDGSNYDYEKGGYANIPFTYNNTSHTLTTEKRIGNFKGMLNNRIFNIVWIIKDKPLSFDSVIKQSDIINYTGEKINYTMQ